MPMTMGTKTAAILSANFCTGGLLPAHLVQLYNLGSIVSLPTLSVLYWKLLFDDSSGKHLVATNFFYR